MKKGTELKKMVSRHHRKTQCSPKELFDSATDEFKVRFRDAYLQFTGMPYTTFYYKVRNDSFRPLEKRVFFDVFEQCNKD